MGQHRLVRAALRRSELHVLLADYERLKAANLTGYSPATVSSVKQQMKELSSELSWRRKQAIALVKSVNLVLGVPPSEGVVMDTALLAMEFGFKAHERGCNLEAARAEFINVLKGG